MPILALNCRLQVEQVIVMVSAGGPFRIAINLLWLLMFPNSFRSQKRRQQKQQVYVLLILFIFNILYANSYAHFLIFSCTFLIVDE